MIFTESVCWVAEGYGQPPNPSPSKKKRRSFLPDNLNHRFIFFVAARAKFNRVRTYSHAPIFVRFVSSSLAGNSVARLTERSEERREGKRGRSRWSPYH